MSLFVLGLDDFLEDLRHKATFEFIPGDQINLTSLENTSSKKLNDASKT